MLNLDSEKNFTAVNDFYRVRNQATLKEIIARFKGKSTELLSYEEVRKKLNATPGSEQGVKDIPLNAIVGSVGRYIDFTRDFLPRRDEDRGRWTRIKLAVTDLAGLPPIDVYKLGDVYFVIDGNHRVSVARHLGATHIQAYVTEVHSRVKLTPDIQPDDLIIKAEYAGFLERTRLDEVRPGADLTVTTAGKYPMLEEHIDLHRYYMSVENHREVSYPEAVMDWYDNVYMPVVLTVRESGILHYYPQRTETDLYLWIAKYRDELESELGWHIRPEQAAVDLAAQKGPSVGSFISRVGGKLLEIITPSALESGPVVGQWRKAAVEVRPQDRLFLDILVAIDGRESGWTALEQAIIIAQREGAKLHGLHIVGSENKTSTPKAMKVKEQFEQRCNEAGIHGHLVVTGGKIANEISSRARWTDLVVTSLLFPPGPQLLSRLDSGFRALIQRCPRPILAVPGRSMPLRHALLAYDGSAKADEALFIAAYLAKIWKTKLKVMTAYQDSKLAPETLLRAQLYLDEHGIEADYIAEKFSPAEAIRNIAQDDQVDLVIMGGYGLSPLMELVRGSTVDQILRQVKVPVMVGR